MEFFEKYGIRIGNSHPTAMRNADHLYRDGTDIIAWDAGIKEE